MTTIVQTTPRKTNGPPAEQAPALPEHRQKTVEAGLATYQQVLAERDDLENKLRQALMKVEALTVQLDALKGVVNMMESTYLTTKLEMENRVNTHMAQRDEAVSRTASLEATLANIYVMLRNTINEPDDGAA
jgi:ABC-type phosphate transport system auxiliary subunit